MCVPFMIIIQFDYYLLACTRQHGVSFNITPPRPLFEPCVQTNIKNKIRPIKTNAPTTRCAAIWITL